jgi:hypothetical protein
VLIIIAEYKISDFIRYFISNNVLSNNVAINVVYRELKLAYLVIRRLRYLGYIINLAAKAFLYGKEEGNFNFEISIRITPQFHYVQFGKVGRALAVKETPSMPIRFGTAGVQLMHASYFMCNVL